MTVAGFQMSNFLKKFTRENRYLYILALLVVAGFMALVMGPFLSADEDTYLIQYGILVFLVIAVAVLAIRGAGLGDSTSMNITTLNESDDTELSYRIRQMSHLELVLVTERFLKKKKRPAFMETAVAELAKRGLAGAPDTIGKTLFRISGMNSDPANNSLSLAVGIGFILKRYENSGYRADPDDMDELVLLQDIHSITVRNYRDSKMPFKEDRILIEYASGGEEKKINFAPEFIDEWIKAFRATGLEVDDRRLLK